MSLGIDTNSSSTPKLITLPKLPCKPKEYQSTQIVTPINPSMHPSISVPFQWEEAPGKPRATTDKAAPPSTTAAETSPAFVGAVKNQATKCLDLPPRLMLHDDAKITKTPSRATSLDGPCVGRSLSLACTFSFRKGPLTGRSDGLRPTTKSRARNFGSERWGSFTEGEVKFSGKGTFWADIYASFKQAVQRRRRQ